MLTRRLSIVMGVILLVMLIAISLVAVLQIDVTPKEEKAGAVVRNRNFATGVQIAQHGLYGVDLVSIGKVHMRKLRKGPFTIGAINELVLEDVSLVLPKELWAKGGRERPDSERADQASPSGPKAMLERLGIKPGQISMSGKIPLFSALQMRDLRIARLVGTNAVPWFAARRGEARRGGLRLENGWSVEGGLTNDWKEALLIVEPELKLITSEAISKPLGGNRSARDSRAQCRTGRARGSRALRVLKLPPVRRIFLNTTGKTNT